MFLCSPCCQASTPQWELQKIDTRIVQRISNSSFEKNTFPTTNLPPRASRLISLSAHKKKVLLFTIFSLNGYLQMRFLFSSYHRRSRISKFSLIHWHWYQKQYEVTACWSYQAQSDKPHHPDYIGLRSL